MSIDNGLTGPEVEIMETMEEKKMDKINWNEGLEGTITLLDEALEELKKMDASCILPENRSNKGIQNDIKVLREHYKQIILGEHFKVNLLGSRDEISKDENKNISLNLNRLRSRLDSELSI